MIGHLSFFLSIDRSFIHSFIRSFILSIYWSSTPQQSKANQSKAKQESSMAGTGTATGSGRRRRALLLLVADLVVSFLWVWAGPLVKLFVYRLLPPGPTPHQLDLLKIALSVAYMFLFAWLDGLTGGASYNPLTVLVYTLAAGANHGGYLFAAFCRIPAQMLGSVAGIWLLKQAFPQVGHGPRLNAGIHHGAFVEGLATFAVVMVSLMLKHNQVNSFFIKTWIASISKMTLHILSSDLTGGIMNPASAFGWAFARGDHITLEHMFVYWVAPIQAALFGIWCVKQFAKHRSSEAQKSDETKSKSD